MEKLQIPKVLDILLQTYPGKGAVELNNPFKVLFATIISQRNKDELTEVVSKRLFNKYPDVNSLTIAKEQELRQLIYPTGFYRQKAKKIIATAKIIEEEFAGRIPRTRDELLTLPGVGRKTANCVLTFGYKIPAIVVDTHVFRIVHRLDWLNANVPIEAEIKLERIVPKKYWLDINRVIVQHGRKICRPVGPKCLDCPIITYCLFGQKKASV